VLRKKGVGRGSLLRRSWKKAKSNAQQSKAARAPSKERALLLVLQCTIASESARQVRKK
jgi:hypothetical protein